MWVAGTSRRPSSRCRPCVSDPPPPPATLLCLPHVPAFMGASAQFVGMLCATELIFVLPACCAAEPPGRPSAALLKTPVLCTTPACIRVDWSYPRVPKHGIWCSGVSSANDCPVTMGRGSEADGGSPITHYTLEWSRDADFCTIDSSADVPASGTGTFTFTVPVRVRTQPVRDLLCGACYCSRAVCSILSVVCGVMKEEACQAAPPLGHRSKSTRF